MFNKILAVISIIFVDPEELRYRGRSLRRVWFMVAIAIMILLSCISGVDAAPVTGEGVAPDRVANPAQARAMALRAAKIVALRNGKAAGYSRILGILSQEYDGRRAIIVLDMQ